MQRDLSFSLHALTARLDRSADRILRTEAAISYSRFLVLFMVRDLGTTTQRALAERLGVTEPSVSRMTASLAQDGLLLAASPKTGGNRRSVSLTARGKALVHRCYDLLEGRLSELVRASDVPYGEYASHTKELLATIDRSDQKRGRGSPGVASTARTSRRST